ncbi:MAG TPA: energy transducer TonB [Rhizomicrobium sp.]|jgi:TonB family protein|nr:energy transducer TonB [Rhizomicrobium sp.]
MRLRALGLYAAVSIVILTTQALCDDGKPHVDTSGVNMQPAYPDSAKATNESGAVILDVVVSPDGKVSSIRLRETSGFNDLDRAAIAAVMNWKFTPAVKDGHPAEGTSTIQLVFQPPADSNAKSTTTSASASASATNMQPSKNLFDSVITISGQPGEYNQEVRAVPCENGKLITTIEMLRAIGPAVSQYHPYAVVRIQSDDSEVSLGMAGIEYIMPPEERFFLNVADEKSGEQRSSTNYSHVATFGKPVGVSLSWDSTGLITASVGTMEEHQIRIARQPNIVGLSMAGGEARFKDTALICTSGAPN